MSELSTAELALSRIQVLQRDVTEVLGQLRRLHDEVPPYYRQHVVDTRWNQTEVLQLLQALKSALSDRLAGATPERSEPTSQHGPGPPDARQEEPGAPAEPQTT